MREYAAARRRVAEFTLSCRRSAWRRDDADDWMRWTVLQFSPKLNVTWEILLAVDGLDCSIHILIIRLYLEHEQLRGKHLRSGLSEFKELITESY